MYLQSPPLSAVGTGPDSAVAIRENPAEFVISGNPDICLLLCSEGTIVQASRGFREAIDPDQGDLAGRHWDRFGAIFGLPSWARVLERANSADQWQTEAWITLNHGRAARFQINFASIRSPLGRITGYFVHTSDLTSFCKSQSVLVRTANEDSLTGLFNRRHLEENCSDLIQSCDQGTGKLGILVIDVDQFKAVNDTYGHNVGDEALRHIAEAITDAVPAGEVVARYGGDEFVVVLRDLQDERQLLEVAEDIQFAVSRPCIVGQEMLKLRVSIGASVFPRHGNTLTELIQQADAAMFVSKKHAKDTFAPSYDRNAGEQVVRELVTALHEHQFVPYFQKIVELDTFNCVGAEALCRWIRPGQGIGYPAEFIPRAESLGMIAEIDKAMFRTICTNLTGPGARELADIQVAFNLSATSLADPSLMEFLDDTLERTGLAADRFCVELTESATLIENGPGWECLYQLHQMGFAVALDDFGTGFSSLSLLKELPISRLKIDKSFVADLLSCRKNRRIIECVAMLSNSLGADCVAEGIETRVQAHTLQQMGLRLGQGKHFGCPLPLAQFRQSCLPDANNVALTG